MGRSPSPSSSSSSGGSSSESSASSGDERRKRKRKKSSKSKKKHHKHSKKKSKKKHKHDKSSKHKQKRARAATTVPTASPTTPGPAPLGPIATAAVGPANASQPSRARPVGPLRPEDAEREANRTSRVYEPETGRWRLMKANGEIVEEIVSKERHAAIQKSASLHVPTSVQNYTGRDKFPSQHPWFGYK
mmetsp:Transcript_62145/g.110764  ORF Transcript_62145/g.110764 Transcript_62145/m.110764 type:complete len:189 (-) Transcript_62145:1243-1809(-)